LSGFYQEIVNLPSRLLLATPLKTMQVIGLASGGPCLAQFDISFPEAHSMSHPRRGFIQAGLALLGSAATARLVAGQDRRSDGVHPPEPSGREMPDPHAPSHHPAMNARQRDLEFRNCLDQLLTSAMKLRAQINGVPLSEILSVQVYRNTQAMERLVKQLKSLAKS
jgi:hypothetical protein